MSKLPYIKAGTRATIAGRTGSGKSTLATWLLGRNNQRWIIFNPKLSNIFKILDDCKVMQSFDARKLDNQLSRHRFVSLNFSPQESTPEFMDAVLMHLHESYENIGVLIDELYTMHTGRRQGFGLTAWLTRGRERKQSYIGLTQRPAWISRFCFSEADYIGAMSLTLSDDKKRMRDNTGRDEFLRGLDGHHWRWYKVADDSLTTWGQVPAIGQING